MKTLQLSMLFSILFYVCQGQNNQQNENILHLFEAQIDGVFLAKDDRYEGIKGSPYLNDSFDSTSVVYSKKTFKTLAKYDLQKGLLLIKKEREVMILDPLKLDQFEMPFENHLLRFFASNGRIFMTTDRMEEKSVYFELTIAFKKANFEGAFNDGSRFDEFAKKWLIYVKVNGEYVQYKSTWKDLANILDTPKKGLKSYATNNQLSISSLADIIRLISEY